MLLSHPLLGGFDMMTGFAGTYIGAGYRFAAPSRFGYLGSSLPPAALPAAQADAYALLLDTLGSARPLPVVFCAGTGSARAAARFVRGSRALDGNQPIRTPATTWPGVCCGSYLGGAPGIPGYRLKALGSSHVAQLARPLTRPPQLGRAGPGGCGAPARAGTRRKTPATR